MVIDENSSLITTLELRNEYAEKFSTFHWSVTVALDVYPMERYDKVSEIQRDQHQVRYFMEDTIHDLPKD